MGRLFKKNGEWYRDTKNLGWVLRHADEVDHIYVRKNLGTRARPLAATVRFHCITGITFEADFADATVLWDWLNRPRFRGKSLWWGQLPRTQPIGEDAKWNERAVFMAKYLADPATTYRP